MGDKETMIEHIEIQDLETAQDLARYIQEDKPQYKLINLDKGLRYKDSDYEVVIPQKFAYLFEEDEYSDDVIYGKDKTKEITSLEVKDNTVYLFFNDGRVEHKKMVYWILAPRKLDKHFDKLEGNQHYKYIRRFTKRDSFVKYCRIYWKKDIFKINNDKESAMIYYGHTMFKGLKVEDVSVLSFDIEANGLAHDESSQVFLITNTFRDTKGNITKKHFRVDHYENDKEMIKEWCDWVVERDPTILNGHNVFGYDLPYLQYCYGESLPLGKYGEPIEVEERETYFRVDGNQKWSYNRIHVFGRHIMDGMFLAVKYDIGRNYPSWGLKQIAEHEGIVKEDRQFYDASKIGQNWNDPTEREKIVAYGVDDSDDSLALYDIHIPSIFYMTQSVPKPFQLMGLSASGAQLNAIMVRAYMQDGHSIPKASEKEYVAGGMSYGIPGVYTNVVKWDAKSYYPSTVLAFDIYDRDKDPKGYYLKMVRYFTHKRFEQKDKHKETGDKYYDDLQASSKVFINSAYGLLGTSGLNFNSFENAQLITKCCRAGLQKAIEWATSFGVSYWWKEYKETNTQEQDYEDFTEIDKKCRTPYTDMNFHGWKLVNLDTDSLSFCKEDGSPYTEEEEKMIFKELNDIMYSEWEDDGRFDQVLVIKAKNYVLVNGDKKKVKGSSITDTKKEPALREMLDELVDDLLSGGSNTVDIYHKYVREACNIKDPSRWAVKKSVTASVLNPQRTNEQVVLDAIKHKNPREGDKFYLYTALDGERQDIKKGEPVFLKNGVPKMIPNNVLKCIEDWNDDAYVEHYVKRVYKTICILENVLDLSQYTKYHLKSNKKLLEELNNE
jgi:DNA polymerase elongation subunit (family B)